jgi:hypothetical protein
VGREPLSIEPNASRTFPRLRKRAPDWPSRKRAIARRTALPTTGAPELASHLIRSLVKDEFDVAQAFSLGGHGIPPAYHRSEAGTGNAMGFVYWE